MVEDEKVSVRGMCETGLKRDGVRKLLKMGTVQWEDVDIIGDEDVGEGVEVVDVFS